MFGLHTINKLRYNFHKFCLFSVLFDTFIVLRKTWIIQGLHDSFHISLIHLLLHVMFTWAVYMSNPRALINCQSWYSTFGQSFGCPHDNWLKFSGSVCWVWSSTGMERSSSWHEDDLMQDFGFVIMCSWRRRLFSLTPKAG